MTKTQATDLVERGLWTAVQAAAAVIIANQSFGADVWKTAAIAGGLALVKCVIGLRVGDKTSASLP